MSHGAEPTRWNACGGCSRVGNGLLLLSPMLKKKCPISCVMVPELSAWRIDERPHCWAAARHEVHGTYRVIAQFGSVSSGSAHSGGPHSSGMSSLVLNIISPYSCQMLVSSYPA